MSMGQRVKGRDDSYIISDQGRLPKYTLEGTLKEEFHSKDASQILPSWKKGRLWRQTFSL